MLQEKERSVTIDDWVPPLPERSSIGFGHRVIMQLTRTQTNVILQDYSSLKKKILFKNGKCQNMTNLRAECISVTVVWTEPLHCLKLTILSFATRGRNVH